jgi:hypothetical protein
MLNYDGTVAYYLNPNDYAFKNDGTLSDITDDTFEGNVMVEIPKTYWKIVDNGDNTASVYVSNKQVDESFNCWSHIDNNGNEIDYCYIPVYNGYSDGTRLRSLSGKAPMHSKSGSVEISLATANNIDDDVIWYTEVYSDRMLINLLLLLIGKSTNTQEVFGNGRSGGSNASSSLLNTGMLDNMGLFYGTQTTDSAVKVFGVENWWGNQWRRIAGWISTTGVHKIKLTYGQFDGSTVDGYNTDGSGYLSTGCTTSGSSGAYLNKMAFTEYGLIPISTGGSATTYYTDGCFFNNTLADGYAKCGARAGSGLIVGAFTSTTSEKISSNAWNIGSFISCKPLYKIKSVE